MSHKAAGRRATAHGHVLSDASLLPAMLTVQEAATFLRIGINEAYLATRTGVIPAIRIGTTIRVPKDALLRRLTEAANVPSQ